MTNRIANFSRAWRWFTALLLALAGLSVASPQPPAAQAAPQSAGTFTVSSTADSNASDPFLTLREALLVAKGGTGPAGLNRAASTQEQAALGGCSFSSSLITGGCGPAVADSIVFSAGLGVHPVISLTASLPAITDTAGTTIDGSTNGVFPIVAASSIITDALLIASNNNGLAGLTIKGAPRDDLTITGNSNQVLTGTVLLAAGRYGLLVDGGDLNLIDSTLIGTSSPAVGACSQGNQQGGIVLTNSAVSNTIQFATVACNTGVGVRLDGSGTLGIRVFTSTISAQSGNGVEFVNGTFINQLVGSTITNNSLDGVLLSGAATTSNAIEGNFIGVTPGGTAAGNGHYGVRLSANAHGNSLFSGCITAFQCPYHNVISGNGLGGVRLETGAASNVIGGNFIGLNPAATAAVPNGGPGVDVDNAPNTQLGAFFNGGANSIAGNSGPGVRFTNTDGGWVTFNTEIGTSSLGNGGPGIELINTTNTAVQAVAVQNNGGAGIAIEGTSSTGDLIAPFFVGHNGGLPIDLGNDGPTPNGAHTPPGPNHWLNYPVVTATSGSVITGTACLSCTVLISLATGNPGAPGGGAAQLQSVVADASGHWSATLMGGHTRTDVTLQACAAPCAYLFSVLPSHSDTSELSPLFTMWVPVMRR